jgi:manganese efflux pump family protein
LLGSVNLIEIGKVAAVAIAVGLDVLAISVGVGVAGVATSSRVRIGLTFAIAEIAMQLIGYEFGSAMGRMFGEIATYVGFGVLAIVGFLMLRSSWKPEAHEKFNAGSGASLVLTALSISLDSLAVGIALPAAGITLAPLLITLSITTISFSLLGLAFGARLGERYEHRAEALAGGILIVLAVVFAVGQAV